MPEVHGIVRTDDGALAGVAVSDGRTVVMSADDGTFRLDAAGPFVWLTRPAGFTTDRWYVPADGRDVRFDLRPTGDDRAPLRFAHVTDLHLSVGGPLLDPDDDALFRIVDGEVRRRDVSPPAVAAPLADAIAAHDVDLVVATGDVTNRGRDAEYAAYLDWVATVPVETCTAPGNHDLMPQPGDQPISGQARQIDRDTYGVVTHRYEYHLGPRWYSFDRGGLHFVVIDWYTLHLGVDGDDQLAWLGADLAATDLPYVLLSHDQLETSLVDALPRPPVAVLSGHRHTCRVVRRGPTLWVSTGTPTFGGLDHAPPHLRVLAWDGKQLDLQTHLAPAAAGPAVPACAVRPDWDAPLRGRSTLSGPVAAGGLVLVATDDAPHGHLTAIDVATGRVSWQHRLPAPGKSDPLIVDDRVVVTTVTGHTTTLEVATGQVVWEAIPADGNDLWVYAPPVSDGRHVFVVEPTWTGAFDLADGRLVWERRDLGDRGPMTTMARPAVVEDTLVVGYFAHLPSLWGIETATGATRWPDDRGRLAFETRRDLVEGLPRSLSASLTVGSDGTVFGRRLGEVAFCVEVTGGATRWEAPVAGWFDPAAPTVEGDNLLTVSMGREVVCLDRYTGALRWTRDLATDRAGVVERPYARQPTSVVAAPMVVDGRVLVARTDGALVTLDLTDGQVVGSLHTGGVLVATPAVVDDRVVTLDTTATVRAFDLDALGGHA